MSDPILGEVRALVSETSGTIDPDLEPSVMWANDLARLHVPLIRDAPTSEEVIARLTGENFFTYPIRTDDPACADSEARFVALLEAIGASLDSLPAELKESSFASSSVVFGRDSRRLSIGFLWHLATSRRFIEHVPDGGRVLEIGGGYGGLARIVKLSGAKVD